jgi:citrate synthase
MVTRRRFSSLLIDKMEGVVHKRQHEFKEFMKEYKNTHIGDITVGQVVGGMRGMPGMFYDTSKLSPFDGITYRGYDLYKVRELSPKAKDGEQPLPEAILWLFLTGEFPNQTEME